MMSNEYEHAQLLQNFMSNSPDSIYFKDLQSRFTMVNQSCADKHGWDSPELVIGKTDFDTFAKEHAERAYADEQHIIQTGDPLHNIEEKETWPDGHVTWASTTKMPLRDPEGRTIGVFGITRDITRRKEAELSTKRIIDEIGAINDELKNDMRMAGRLQKSFFSTTYPQFSQTDGSGECIEFLHRFVLNRQVTGDYCAVIEVSDHEAGIFISDVRGIGIRAALGTALIRGIMQEISAYASDPGDYLRRMNGMLLPLLKQEGFTLEVKACYLVIDIRTGVIRMANAGHTMPIHFKDGFIAQWLCNQAECIGPALALDENAVYATVEQTVAPDDAVVIFTDGLTGVKNNMQDTYGNKRLLDSAHSFAGEPLEDIFDGLEGDALAFSNEGKFSDDVCMVGFHLKQLMN